MTKEAYYFSHDSNAQHDEKILRLRQKHGWEGYGIYWALIERLRDSNAFALRSHYDSIAFDMQVHCDIIKSIVEDFDLFSVENGFFYSESLKKRMELREEKSEKARKSAQIRWGKQKKDANAMQQQVSRNAIKERKVKERKEKESNKELHELQKVISENYPNILKLKNQLTFNEAENLDKDYNRNEIIEYFDQMENKKDLSINYTSVNLTIRNWMRRGNVQKKIEHKPTNKDDWPVAGKDFV
jgi:Asp-tRNA(Asn)/Glu-tRNA(Gln) amidotransferase C subunit